MKCTWEQWYETFHCQLEVFTNDQIYEIHKLNKLVVTRQISQKQAIALGRKKLGE